MNYRVEHLLSAPLFLSPQPAGDRIYFISSLSGQMSLWRMDAAGGMPESLLPADVGLFNPSLVTGEAFVVLPRLGVIVVMIDRAGDENLQPHLIGIDGGDPVPLFGDRFDGQQSSVLELDPDGIGTMLVDPRVRPEFEAYQISVPAAAAEMIGVSKYGGAPLGHTVDRSKYLLVDEYATADGTLWLSDRAFGERRLLYGTPLDDRAEGQSVPLTGFGRSWFVGADERTVLIETLLFDDFGGLGRFRLDAAMAAGGAEEHRPVEIEPVPISGTTHTGAGELSSVERLDGARYLLSFNVDGVSWGYEAELAGDADQMTVVRELWGRGALSDGVVQHYGHDRESGRIAVAYSSASRPAQLAVLEPAPPSAPAPVSEACPSREPTGGVEPRFVTTNRVLGVDPDLLSAGEDASYESHDGLRISARLYLPAERLGYEGPRPIVHYIHGGPHGQERPDFTWFSMPLIQYFTLRGFAVFVPNVRGSHGYGLSYMKRVDRDWGGQDRLDHVAAVEHLAGDRRLDTDRIGVMGRSYGGFMTQTLVGRHPELWKAGVAMFGPYDLLVWIGRLPPAWQNLVAENVGHPERDRDLLIDRSPKTHLGNLACPLLVIQGANDSRVMRAESDDLVAELRAAGKDIEYLVFEDEGHDLTKLSNKIRCYNAIVEFFTEYLAP